MLILIAILTFPVLGKDTSFANGDWQTNSTWTKGIEPTMEDTLIVGEGITVTISSNLSYNTPVIIYVKGTLRFEGKLRLPSGSKLVFIDGKLESVGGDNSDKITIGGTHVWNGKYGDVEGNFNITEEGGVLPVTWGILSITAICNQVELDWSTYTEKNNDIFVIETSEDTEVWEVVSTVKGNGTTNSISYYTTRFNSTSSGYLYVRIKQIDYNGEYGYSPMISIIIRNTKTLYYIDLLGEKYYDQPKGLSIAVHENGSKVKVFFVTK